jgi:hypothetical protein
VRFFHPKIAIFRCKFHQISLIKKVIMGYQSLEKNRLSGEIGLPTGKMTVGTAEKRLPMDENAVASG